jgi:CRISPR-associated endonuclease/helicase Cas3
MISFAEFFAAAHADVGSGAPGLAPYPWQAALAHRLATAAPPKAIDVPTGAGKTATIDALVWALAFQAERATVLRTVGVRTVWAIDRRILVDEVHAHATALADRLARAVDDAEHGLHTVARALQTLTGNDGSPPLVATRWRGGIPIGSPAQHPLQPEIITSTVAQVGSRLLFRGYGVGSRSLPVQAALAAVDTTVCIDEAHLAEPFRQTVERIVEQRREERLALPPLHLITLTATPSADLDPVDVVQLGDADRQPLGRRLTGEKTARLTEPVTEKAADRRDALLSAIESHLASGAGSVACVVNSVRTAVDVHHALERRCPDAERAILIGPQRPADRAQLLGRHRAVLFGRETGRRPLVLVATQTFEVGLDADVEALVTESASAAALVQRLGRLNRAGTRTGAATIVRDATAALYADAEPAAWAWLQSLAGPDGTIDVSVDALRVARDRPLPATAVGPPALTVDVLDRLVQTGPRPSMMDDPDIDVFLRGAATEASDDVMIAWRADLREGDTEAEGQAYREALLRLAPPQPEELVTVSVARAYALLAALRAEASARSRLGARLLDGPDIEGWELPLAVAQDAGSGAALRVLLRGDEHIEDPSERLRPGDVVVLPCTAGGYRGEALDHAATAVVPDVGPDVAAARRARGTAAGDIAPAPFWRLTEAALAAIGADARTRRKILRAAAIAADAGRAGKAEQATGKAREVVDLLAESAAVDPAALGIDDAMTLDIRRVTPVRDYFAGDVDDEDLVDADDIGLGFDLDQDDEEDALPGDAAVTDADERTESDAFVLTVRVHPDPSALRSRGAPPTLEAHALAVAARVTAYAVRAELPLALVETLTLAGRAHDHGKADPRNQAFFRGGGAGLDAEPIAKSVFGTDDRRAGRAARLASGLPHDLRHEVESVVILQHALAGGGVDDLAADVDVDLLLHVVGTHHGLGLPVPRLPHGGAPPRAYAVDAAGVRGVAAGDGQAAWDDGEWLERFLRLNERYGSWGLAYLRTLLVLADRTVSSEDGGVAPVPPSVTVGELGA